LNISDHRTLPRVDAKPMPRRPAPLPSQARCLPERARRPPSGICRISLARAPSCASAYPRRWQRGSRAWQPPGSSTGHGS